MGPRFNDKVALVTGGGGGIGRATALLLAEEKAKVAVADLKLDDAEQTATLIRQDGGEALAIEVDVREESSVATMINTASTTFGSIDVLVTCAGIGKTMPLLETDLDTWNQTLAVNLTGTFLCCKAVAPAMIEKGWGRIVLIGSINSRKALKHRNAYATSKAGVFSLAQLLAVELAEHGITANCIAPGPVETALTERMHDQTIRDAYHARLPIKRYGQPEEIAASIAFLASEEAAYITGHLLDVDGGFEVSGL